MNATTSNGTGHYPCQQVLPALHAPIRGLSHTCPVGEECTGNFSSFVNASAFGTGCVCASAATTGNQICGVNVACDGEFIDYEASSDVFSPLIYAIGEALCIVLVGYVLVQVDYLPAAAAGGLGPMAGKIGLPALIFRSMAKLDVSSINVSIITAVVGAKWVVMIISLVFGLCMGSKSNRLGMAGLVAICTTQSNDMALGLPVLRALFGDGPRVDLLFVLAAASAILVTPIDITVLELAKSKAQSSGNAGDSGESLSALMAKVAKQVITSPLIVCVFFGLFCNVIFHLIFDLPAGEIPYFLDRVCGTIGAVFPGIALFLTGMGMVKKASPGETRGGDDSLMMVFGIVIMLLKGVISPMIARFLAQALSDEPSIQTCNAGLQSDCCENPLLCDSCFAFLVGAIPSGAANVAIVGSYGLPVAAAANGVVLGMALFAPFTFTSVVLLMSTNAAQVWAAIRVVSKTSVTGGVISCAFIMIAALGANLATPASFPRDIPFYLSLAFLLFATLHYACDHYSAGVGPDHVLSEDTTFMMLYYATCFFRVQGRVLAVLRTFLTCSYVPKRGVEGSRKWKGLVYAAIWIVPALYVLTLPVLLEPIDGLFTCWNMFGEGQFILDAVLFTITLLLCGGMLVYSMFSDAAVPAHDPSDDAQGSIADAVSNPVSKGEAGSAPDSAAEDLMTLPTDTQPEAQHRTQLFASCVCLNCIMHLFLIYAIVAGEECIQGDDPNGLCPDNISCPGRRGGGLHSYHC
eukprot:COSAG01_NODE_2477_length_7615_cov_7.259609_4_plen_747_part_00